MHYLGLPSRRMSARVGDLRYGGRVRAHGNITTAGTYRGAVTTAIVCIGAITGTNDKTQTGATKPGFTYNLLQGETAGSTITVKTATIDPKESTLNIA